MFGWKGLEEIQPLAWPGLARLKRYLGVLDQMTLSMIRRASSAGSPFLADLVYYSLIHHNVSLKVDCAQ